MHLFVPETALQPPAAPQLGPAAGHTALSDSPEGQHESYLYAGEHFHASMLPNLMCQSSLSNYCTPGRQNRVTHCCLQTALIKRNLPLEDEELCALQHI